MMQHWNNVATKGNYCDLAYIGEFIVSIKFASSQPGLTNGEILWNGIATASQGNGVNAGQLVPLDTYVWQLYLKNCSKDWDLITTQSVNVIY